MELDRRPSSNTGCWTSRSAQDVAELPSGSLVVQRDSFVFAARVRNKSTSYEKGPRRALLFQDSTNELLRPRDENEFVIHGTVDSRVHFVGYDVVCPQTGACYELQALCPVRRGRNNVGHV